MEKSKSELLEELIGASEKISDIMDDLQIPHIFITFKTISPYGVNFCNGGNFLQSLFLALTVLLKTIETVPELHPVLKTLWGVLDQFQKGHPEGEEERSPESHPEGMPELDEAFKEIFGREEEKEGTEKPG